MWLYIISANNMQRHLIQAFLHIWTQQRVEVFFFFGPYAFKKPVPVIMWFITLHLKSV